MYFFLRLFAYYFLKLHLHYFSTIKIHKEVTEQWELRFSYYFCLIIVGSGAGSVPRTTSSGSRRPKNIRLLFFETLRAITRNNLVLLVYLVLRNLVGNQKVGAFIWNSKNKLPADGSERHEKLLAFCKNFAGRTVICIIFTTQSVLTNTLIVICN